MDPDQELAKERHRNLTIRRFRQFGDFRRFDLCVPNREVENSELLQIVENGGLKSAVSRFCSSASTCY